MNAAERAALRRAGIMLPDGMEDKPARKVKLLPKHCVLDRATSHGGARFEVTIHGFHPTRLNVLKSAHWAKSGRLKYSDAEIIGGELRRAGVTGAIGKRRLCLVIVLGPGRRAPDPDAHFKSALDGLVRCGALKDDNRKWLDLMPTRYERQSSPSTRIIIEDI